MQYEFSPQVRGPSDLSPEACAAIIRRAHALRAQAMKDLVDRFGRWLSDLWHDLHRLVPTAH